MILINSRFLGANKQKGGENAEKEFFFLTFSTFCVIIVVRSTFGTTDNFGQASIEFYNNSVCNIIDVSAEGITRYGFLPLRTPPKGREGGFRRSFERSDNFERIKTAITSERSGNF